jgi:hypothetical protein
MTIGTTGRPLTKLRLTFRGRMVLAIAWTALLIVGMVTAKYGVPGWDF